MNIKLSLVVLVLAVGILSKPGYSEPTVIRIKNTIANREFSLKVEFPDDFLMTKKEGPDFDFYEIHKESKVFLAIYVGNHPNFPYEHIEGSETTNLDICIDDAELRRKVHDKPLEQIRILSEWKSGKLVHRELQARYSIGAGWPEYIHAITTRYLSEEEVQVADRILFSINLKPEAESTSSGE